MWRFQQWKLRRAPRLIHCEIRRRSLIVTDGWKSGRRGFCEIRTRELFTIGHFEKFAGLVWFLLPAGAASQIRFSFGMKYEKIKLNTRCQIIYYKLSFCVLSMTAEVVCCVGVLNYTKRELKWKLRCDSILAGVIETVSFNMKIYMNSY